MDTARYVVGTLVVTCMPPAMLWWFLIHPFVDFWRRVGPRATLAVMAVLGAVGIGALIPVRDVLLIRDLGTHPLAWALAAVCLGVSVAIALQRRKQLDTRTLAGLPELSLEADVNFAHTEDFTAIELPYKNKKFSMFLFMPPQGSSVDALIGKLNGSTWSEWLGEFGKVSDLDIKMPKFEFDYQRMLSGDLKAMGLDVAFSEMADFSGISEIPLLISEVIHKTYIKVNEKGTEAAAVTAVVMELTSIGPMAWFERPFMFAITETSSNSILFVGKVMEP